MPDFDSSRGVMLIGHGTRDRQGTREFFELADRLTALISPVPVAPALLEFQRPSIADAWQTLVKRGVTEVHAAPLLLFAAGHAKQDIPGAIEQCRRQYPQMHVHYGPPLSRHRKVVELVVARVESTIRTMAAQRQHRPQPVADAGGEAAALIMVGRGNRDPCAQSDMRVLGELAGHRLPLASTMTAFYAMAEPRFTTVLEQVAASNRYRSIAVHPHLLFDGRLFQAIVRQTDEAARRHRHLQIHCGSYLGPDLSIAQAIADLTIKATPR